MYVATPQGYRRKIGPRSRYGTTSNEPAFGDGVGPQGPQSSMNFRQSVGSGRSSLDASFGSNADRVSRERAEREQADRFLASQEKRKANQARKREGAQAMEAKTSTASQSAAANMAAGAMGGGVAAQLSSGISSFLEKQRTATDRVTRAKQAAADRAKAHSRYEAEKSGKAPVPAVAEKKPETRKEAVMPTATHASPVRATASKPASKPEPKTVAPHLLFTDRAPKQESPPAPKTRAIDSYVSNPANRSVMTGKTRAQEIAEEAAAKKKRERDNMFRPKYMPNKARF